MSDVKIRLLPWDERAALPKLAPCLVKVLDTRGDVDLLGFSGRFAERPIWDALRKAGDEVSHPCGEFQGRFWRISKADQAGVVQVLSKAANGWPWLTLSSEGCIVPNQPGARADVRATRRAVSGRCGKVTFQIFGARDPGAQEFAACQPYSHLVDVPGRKDKILLCAGGGVQPALPAEISADPRASQLDLLVPTARLRRRGWVMDLVLDGDKLAIAATMAAARMPSRGGWQDWAASASSFPVVEWPSWRVWLQTVGVEWVVDGFDPDDLWGEVQFDEASIPGWDGPTAVGAKLREFQKDGVRFVMSRRGRALLADDMGLGKTAQAIATVAAMKAARVLILSPAVVKSVWLAEIEKWSGVSKYESGIQMLAGAHDRPQNCKWLIASYDQVVSRAETWKAASEPEFLGVSAVIKETVGFADPEDDDDLRPRLNKKDRKIKFSQSLRTDVVDLVAAGLTPASALKWSKLHSRLRGELQQALLEWAPDLLVLDEAHRVKSADAKRTSVAIALSARAGGCLAMSGTPIQNSTNEPAVLLHVINPAAYQEVKREKIPIVRIKALLAPVMLRRRKQDVLNELPLVTEQIVRIAVPDYVDDGEDEILQELLALGRNLELDGIKPNDWAAAAPAHIKHLALAWSAGTELSKFEVVRAQLAEMKAHASMVLDFVKDALENKGCLVVFTAHHAASDALAAGIRGAGWKVGVADGRTSLPRRVQLVSDFQKSHLDCLVCGMDAMGEGVTLHRADMVVFLEMAYKPSTLHQSRDRLHRIGQTRNVQAVYLLSDHPLDEFLEMMVLGKAELVGKVLSERVHVLGQDRGDVSIASPWPEAMSNGEFVADKPKTAVVSKESLHEIVSNGDAQTVTKQARSTLPDEDHVARQHESKRKWKVAHPEQQTDHSRALAAERIRRWREKQGDAYRAKQREYVKTARERKALVNGRQGESV